MREQSEELEAQAGDMKRKGKGAAPQAPRKKSRRVLDSSSGEDDNIQHEDDELEVSDEEDQPCMDDRAEIDDELGLDGGVCEVFVCIFH